MCLEGLSNETMNGAVGTIRSFVVAKGRYEVEIDGKEAAVCVKPLNIVNIDPKEWESNKVVAKSSIKTIKLWCKRERKGNAQFTREEIAEFGQGTFHSSLFSIIPSPICWFKFVRHCFC